MMIGDSGVSSLSRDGSPFGATEQWALYSAAFKRHVLVVEDEEIVGDALRLCLEEGGYLVSMATNGRQALNALAIGGRPDIILLDLRMPVMNGWEFRGIQTLDPKLSDIPVVAISADGTAQAEALSAHAHLLKPVDAKELLGTIARILSENDRPIVARLTAHERPAALGLPFEADRRECRPISAKVVALPVVFTRGINRSRIPGACAVPGARVAERRCFDSIVAGSETMETVFTMVEQIAPSRATVLITGESGTGKELIAAAIHERSRRAVGPFVRLHCGALADSLLESELFGHERGAFTGALNRREGRFFRANRGTLFLDEIGEISRPMQVKLLRFLQEREFERVGSNETITVDVRIIAATNRNIQEMVSAGTFREDLFYRLNVITLEMPPLRARPSDTPLLADHFLRKYNLENCKHIGGFSPEALECLTAYRWPGNVRELENVVERAVVMARSTEITLADLPTQITGVGVRRSIQIPGATLLEIEDYAINRTLEAAGGSTQRTAEILDISVRKIQYKLREYERHCRLPPSP